MRIYPSCHSFYFPADLRMYNRFCVTALGACVRACVYAFYFAKNPRGGPTPP